MRRSLLHPNQNICRYYFTNYSSCRIFNHGNTIHTVCRSLPSRRGGSIKMGPRRQPSRDHDRDRGCIFRAVIRLASCRTVCVVHLLSLRLWAISLWRISEMRISCQHGGVMVIVNTFPVPLIYILLTLQPNTSLKMSASKGSERRSSANLNLWSECTTAEDY